MSLKKCLGALISFVILSILGFTAYTYFITAPLNFERPLKETTKVYDSKGVLLDELHGEEHRIVVPSNKIDSNIKAAVVAIEDANFYNHYGVSVRGVGRAISKATKDSIAAGELSVSEGASTIPMQLAKNLNGSVQDRTIANKITETIQAIKLNRTYSKDEILTKYLNVIYWGNNTYGIQTATQTYFGKDASNVTLPEAALLAAMIQNPSRFNPYHSNDEVKHSNYKSLKNRQKAVLFNLSYSYSGCTQNKLEDGSIDKVSYVTCLEEWTLAQWNTPLKLSGPRAWKNPTGTDGYIVDLAINELIETKEFGIKSKKDLEEAGLGLNIYSTINRRDQNIAGKVIEELGRNKGTAQVATTGINPNTGSVIFSVGGKDYNNSNLNRATKYGGLKGRQAGSSMKPWVYYTAMGDFKWTPNSTIVDAPYCPVRNYCPKNYGGAFVGVDSLLNHMKRSRNIPAVKLGMYVGIKNVIRNMRKVGYTTKLDAVPSFPLGSNDVYLDQHTAGYAAFANGGYKVSPFSLALVRDTQGNILYQNISNKEGKELSTKGVVHTNTLLRQTAISGTAYLANTIPNVHAKTGTTDKEADIWCMAYVPGKISMGTWFGNDDYHKKMYGASSVTWACPVSGRILQRLNQAGSI